MESTVNIHARENPSEEAMYLFSDPSCCQFPGFGEYILPQLQTCTALVLSADCTEGSDSSNIIIFNNLFVFNFLFFQFLTIFSSSLDKYHSFNFDVVTTID